MKTKWHIGCSGFYYKEWKEVFYPKGLAQGQWFEYYAQHFNTLELNVTFYRFPELTFLQKWHQKSPDNFMFAAKVPKEITHNKKFTGTHELMNQFYEVLRFGLAEKLGPVLFQLPPKMDYKKETLEAIISHTDPSFTNAIEFRNISWWRKEVLEILGENNITFCGASFPGLPDEAVVNNDTCYYRFHGVPKLYYSSYNDEFLTKTISNIQHKKEVKNAFIFFNNTASGAALDNAKFVQKLVS
jgi:uncharacterized protein YecE (DUF72 family)